MKPHEYIDKIEKAEKEYKRQLNLIKAEFAFSNNDIKKGDIVCNGTDRIKVEKIMWSMTLKGYPECVYYGPRLTKKNIPFKSGETDSIYQSSIK